MLTSKVGISSPYNWNYNNAFQFTLLTFIRVTHRTEHHISSVIMHLVIFVFSTFSQYKKRCQYYGHHTLTLQVKQQRRHWESQPVLAVQYDHFGGFAESKAGLSSQKLINTMIRRVCANESKNAHIIPCCEKQKPSRRLMLASADHVFPQSIIPQGAQIIIRRTHRGILCGFTLYCEVRWAR